MKSTTCLQIFRLAENSSNQTVPNSEKILDILIPYTILYPEISFLIVHNKKTLLELHPDSSEKCRMSKVFNIHEQNILEITWRSLDNSVFLKLISGDTNVQRPRKDTQFIYVNRRPVQHNGLSFVTNDIFRNFLPSETYPVFALFLQVEKENVDVNVHPAKREVKIKNEAEILNAVRTILGENLSLKIQPGIISYQEKTDFLPNTHQTIQEHINNMLHNNQFLKKFQNDKHLEQ